jgi:hypothetical protein
LARRFEARHGDIARVCSSSTRHSQTVKLSHRCHCPTMPSQECLVLAIHFTFTPPYVSPVAVTVCRYGKRDDSDVHSCNSTEMSRGFRFHELTLKDEPAMKQNCVCLGIILVRTEQTG